MKKSILFCMHSLEIGGAERALLGLLYSIDYEKYDVDLFLMRHHGEFMKMLPPNVHLLPEIREYTGLAVPMVSLIKRGLFGVCLGRLEAKVRSKLYQKQNPHTGDSSVELEYSHKYTRRFMPEISSKEYDLAVSFLTPHYFAAEKVRAKKRVAWIHTDYSTLQVDATSELAMWEKYDNIISISEDCTAGFVQVFPTLKDKIVLIQNISSPKLIQMQADEFDAKKEMRTDGKTVLLSIGRYAFQKNFDNVPDICRRMLEKGVNVKWYLIGFGSDEMRIHEKIRENGMEEHVIMLGKRSNPYPYIKACDVYVQPSRYEGKAVTVREAQILCKPVIITNYPTASSQIEEGIDGVIVPLDNKACAEEMAAILTSSEVTERLKRNCENRNYNNTAEAEKLYGLIG